MVILRPARRWVNQSRGLQLKLLVPVSYLVQYDRGRNGTNSCASLKDTRGRTFNIEKIPNDLTLSIGEPHVLKECGLT